MKVVVCFDHVRVTVPCGDGAIPVRELINKAVHRYKRATGKGSSHWIEVTNLKTISGGGILDPDDQLNDVVDDREQLVAEFEEQDRPSSQHNGGDGASASSTGTTSPDIFQANTSSLATLQDLTNKSPGSGLPPTTQNSTGSNNVGTDVVVTVWDLQTGSNLRVRRGSEPTLNLISSNSPDENQKQVEDDSKVFLHRRESVRESDDPQSESSDDGNSKNLKVTIHGSLDRKKLGHNHFVRDAFRTSLSTGPEMYHWLEAQEKAEKYSRRTEAKERTGPIKGHDGEDMSSLSPTDSYLITLQNDGGPLGIHAVPAHDESGKVTGLMIQSIEPGRPVDQDGRLKPGDVVVDINGMDLYDLPFIKAQSIFRAAMDSSVINLRVKKGSFYNPDSASSLLKAKLRPAPPPPPVLPKPRNHAPVKPSPLTFSASETRNDLPAPTPAPRDTSKRSLNLSNVMNGTSRSDEMDSSETSTNFVPKIKSESLHSSKNTSPSPSSHVIKPGPPIKAPKKLPPKIPLRSPGTALSAPVVDASLNAVTNTRKIGKKLFVQLKKGPLGLGFSVTSRDNQTDGNCPIYIRNILPKGAAVQSGQLLPGDRLLEVNGVKMTGKTQAEAVTFLRMLPEGSVVDLVLSRQEEVEEKFKIPRKLGDQAQSEYKMVDDDDDEDVVFGGHSLVSPLQLASVSSEGGSPPASSSCQRITLQIPLNETGSAGLGVSVKGKTESTESGIKDLGIFVKTVLQGGAAYKDGRLQVNDQLMKVNDVELEGLSNAAAMEALRLAMRGDSREPGVIKLSVSRRVDSEPSILSPRESPDNSHTNIPPVQKPSTSATDIGPVILHQRSSSASDPAIFGHHPYLHHTNMPSPIAPARGSKVAALREQWTGSTLRNESYTRATHESFNDSQTFQNMMSPSNNFKNKLHSQSQVGQNTWIQNSETYSAPQKAERPHSTIGFMHTQHSSQSSASEDEAMVRSSPGSHPADDSDLSPQGELNLPFSREGFGRQSMSEKRKGHLDPRSSEVYKLVKATKEIKDNCKSRRVQSFHIPGSHQSSSSFSQGIPSNIKRASSLENLVNAPASRTGAASGVSLANSPPTGSGVSRNSDENNDLSSMWKPNRFGRARTCNDSFRAAVDRSYEALDPNLMDTLEEESGEGGAPGLDPSHSSQSSVSGEPFYEDTNSLQRRKAQDKDKKGLFKTFLRFGKGRKSDEDAIRRSRSEERSESRTLDRRIDYSSERPMKEQWAAQPYGDSHSKWQASSDEAQHQRERKSSQQQQQHQARSSETRVHDDYPGLRDQYIGVQRLRSQSVEPFEGRGPLMSSSSSGMSSPFQPYSSSRWQQQPQPHHQPDKSDPRSWHPAAVSNQPHFSGYDYVGKNQSCSSSEPQAELKPNMVKATMSRAEYIQQLRSLYQQRHQQRQGVYPLEDKEEQYERQLRERENTHWEPVSADYHTYLREQNLPHHSDRPASRQSDERSSGSSFTMLNVNNSTTLDPNSLSYHHQHHQPSPTHPAASHFLPRDSHPHHQLGWHTSGPLNQETQQHPQHQMAKMRPQPHNFYVSASAQPSTSQPSLLHSQPGNRTQIPSPLSYHILGSQSQPLTEPAKSYPPVPNQYGYHRGRVFPDSGSTKV